MLPSLVMRDTGGIIHEEDKKEEGSPLLLSSSFSSDEFVALFFLHFSPLP